MDKGFSSLNSYKTQATKKDDAFENKQTVISKNTSNSIKNENEEVNKGQHQIDHSEKHPFSNPKHSPIKIPNNALVKKQSKKGYEQIKYYWHKGNYKYESRWHTKTPNAPNGEESWVVTRTTKGKGYGKNPIPKKIEVKVGNKWVSWTKWNEAIEARKNNVATKKQINMLNKGHFTKKR